MIERDANLEEFETKCQTMVDLLREESDGDLLARVVIDESFGIRPYVHVTFSEAWLERHLTQIQKRHGLSAVKRAKKAGFLQAALVPFEGQDGWMAHSIGQNPYHPPVDVRSEYGSSDLDAVHFVMGEWFF